MNSSLLPVGPRFALPRDSRHRSASVGPRARLLVMHKGVNSRSSLGWLTCGQVHCPPPGPSGTFLLTRTFPFPPLPPPTTTRNGPSLPENPGLLGRRAPGLFSANSHFHPSLSHRPVGPGQGNADFEEVKGAGARPSSNKWVAERGDTVVGFSCPQKRGLSGRCRGQQAPSRAPRGADRHRQLCGRRGARAPRRAPLLRPLPAAPPDLSTHPTMTQGPPLPGAKGQAAGPPRDRVPGPDAKARAGIRLQPAGPGPGRVFLGKLTGPIFLPASYGLLLEPPQCRAPRGTSQGCFCRISPVAPCPIVPCGIIELRRMS